MTGIGRKPPVRFGLGETSEWGVTLGEPAVLDTHIRA
jgi:hypothetical protein